VRRAFDLFQRRDVFNAQGIIGARGFAYQGGVGIPQASQPRSPGGSFFHRLLHRFRSGFGPNVSISPALRALPSISPMMEGRRYPAMSRVPMNRARGGFCGRFRLDAGLCLAYRFDNPFLQKRASRPVLPDGFSQSAEAGYGLQQTSF
jgi:hypothetical protein